MGTIQVLEASVADQIAAGEVVERPASVVKELLENALDAGATRVEVEVQGGGLQRISVIDDGAGMDAADAVLCFSRHATSKLRHADDLQTIGTFGFRGEALAAISSVAKVRLRSRTAADASAHEVRVEGGRVVHIGEAGAPLGTRIDVEELFFNTPARRKFLKAERTEAGHIEDVMASAALGLPGVSFRVVVDGKTVLDLAAAPPELTSAGRIARVVECLGNHVRPVLFPFEGKTELLGLTGYVVAPLETRRDLAGIHLSVNNRPVSDRGLVQAVRTAFRTLLEVGRQPIVALDIRIDPRLVDVNVHPRKAEVRFVDPRRVTGHVIALLSDFLAGTPWLKGGSPAPRIMTLTGGGPPVDAVEAGNALADAHRERVRDALARLGLGPRGASGFGGPSLPTMPTGAPSGAPPGAPRAFTPVLAVGAGAFASLRVVGQIGGTYLVLEGPDGMVVIDQHAAHERVVFERLRARTSEGSPTQPLLIPLTVEMNALEMSALEDEDTRALLQRYGLVVEPFGPRTAVVKAVPPGLDARRAAEIARDALAEASAGGGTGALDDRVDRVCSRLACHAAVRAGDVLAPESVRALLRDLDAIDLGAHCPHGRPVARTVRLDELAGWFDRR